MGISDKMNEDDIDVLLAEVMGNSRAGLAAIRDLPAEIRTYARYSDRQLQELVEAGAHADPAFVELELRMNANLGQMVELFRTALKVNLKIFVLLSRIEEKLGG